MEQVVHTVFVQWDLHPRVQVFSEGPRWHENIWGDHYQIEDVVNTVQEYVRSLCELDGPHPHPQRLFRIWAFRHTVGQMISMKTLCAHTPLSAYVRIHGTFQLCLGQDLLVS